MSIDALRTEEAMTPLRSRPELRAAILGALNSERPIRREDLAHAVGATERRVREALSDLVATGHPIASDGRRGFVYRPSEAIAEKAESKLRKAALSILARAAALRRTTTAKYTRQLALELEGVP